MGRGNGRWRQTLLEAHRGATESAYLNSELHDNFMPWRRNSSIHIKLPVGDRRDDIVYVRWSGLREGELLKAGTSLIIGAITAGIAATRLPAQASDTVYRIEGGSYAGIVVPVQRSLATRKGSKFWRIVPRTDGRIVGWNPRSLPARVAFRAGQGIDQADSAEFWKILRGMELDLGMHLFSPATVSADEDPDNVVLVGVRPMAGDDGVTLMTWGNDGAVYDARVFFRSRTILHNEGVVQHEMMHALGFGHTMAWSSIMSPVPGARRLSTEDVAYAQVAMLARAESERVDMWERIALAVERSSPAHGNAAGSEACQFSSPKNPDLGLRTVAYSGPKAIDDRRLIEEYGLLRPLSSASNLSSIVDGC